MGKLDEGVITLAYGASKYIEMSKTLVRSLKIHSPSTSCTVVTDVTQDPEINALYDCVIPLKKEYGANVRQKLYLDLYSPYKRTIFIDCDCIVVRDVNFMFSELEGYKFTVPGDDKYLYRGDSDPFVDVDFVLDCFSIERIPKFNGGLYYFEKCNEVYALFSDARTMLADSHKLGFATFRGDGAADEPIISVAMVRHNMHIYQDLGRMMRTPIGIRGGLKLDVMAGVSSFIKVDKMVAPAIVHFCGKLNENPMYLRESLRVKSVLPGSDCPMLGDSFYERKLKYGYLFYFFKFKIVRAFRMVCRFLDSTFQNRGQD